MAIGYIYIVSNPAMGKLLKIGYTCDDVELRVRELSSSTGVPVNFTIVYCHLTLDAQRCEAAIHAELSARRYNRNREFFDIPADEAIEIVKRHITEPLMSLQQGPAFEMENECWRCGYTHVKTARDRYCPKCGF